MWRWPWGASARWRPRTHTTRAASDEAVQEPATPRVHRHATAESKEEAAEAFEARRASPYYKHVQVVVKYWTHLGNLFSAAGSSTVAQTAKDMGSALRKANLPDAQDEQREVALQQEAELLAQLKPRYPDGEVGAILDYLEAASEAAKNGEIPPPKPDIEFSIDYGADATDANK